MSKWIIAVLLAAAPAAAEAATMFRFEPQALWTDPGAPYEFEEMRAALELAPGAAADGRVELEEVAWFRLWNRGENPADLIPSAWIPNEILFEAEIGADGALAGGVIRNLTSAFFFHMEAGPDGLWEGLYITDNLNAPACDRTRYPCRFSGRWLPEATAIDAPAGAALTVALAALWRRRR